MATPSDRKNMHTIPIADRPRHGSWWNTLMFPLLFNLGILGIATAQMCALPLLLIPFVGRRMFGGVVDWTKDGFGRLLILITVLFAPTSLHISATSPPHLSHLIERDASGRLTKVNLPDRLVIMSNHQAYTDWMYLWALSCYAGHASGMIILLKWSLRGIPLLGWGMRNFRFIFMKRSWAADRENLTKSLRELGARARASGEKVEAASRRKMGPGSASQTSTVGEDGKDGTESSPLLANAQSGQDGRSPLWLLIFPEGTITSDEERVKSVRYAEREGIPDLTTMLHPRSTGLLFCLRTLLPQVPDLQLLDVTIGYTGVPVGKYPQEYYGLGSIFFRGVPPPSVHVHLHLYDNLSAGEEISGIPSLLPSAPDAITTDAPDGIQHEVKTGSDEEPLASPEEARAFELWLRKLWIKKDQRLIDFGQEGKYRFKEEEQGVEIVKMRQVKWYHWISAMGGGGVGTVGAFGAAIHAFVTRSRS